MPKKALTPTRRKAYIVAAAAAIVLLGYWLYKRSTRSTPSAGLTGGGTASGDTASGTGLPGPLSIGGLPGGTDTGSTSGAPGTPLPTGGNATTTQTGVNQRGTGPGGGPSPGEGPPSPHPTELDPRLGQHNPLNPGYTGPSLNDIALASAGLANTQYAGTAAAGFPTAQHFLGPPVTA